MTRTHAQNRTTVSRRNAPRGSGVAMIETLLALAIILPLLSLLIYLGLNMTRAQRAVVMDRYESWRRASHVRLLMVGAENDLDLQPGEPLGPATRGADTSELNAAFFGDRATSIDVNTAPGAPADATDELELAAAAVSADAGNLAHAIQADLPISAAASFATTHQSSSTLWQTLDGPVHHSHIRPDGEWRFAGGWRVAVIAFDQPYDWNYDKITVPPGSKHELLKFENTHTFKQGFVTAGTRLGVLEREGAYQVWQRRWPIVAPQAAIRDTFLGDLDSQLTPIAQQGNGVASSIRHIYSVNPHYVGPTLAY